jgi:pyridoxine kinase
MARILSISSQVVRGHVGNSAAVPALQRLGHEVWPLPTVVLSNHPGHPKVAGMQVPPETMLGMVQALGDNGWLAAVDVVSTGYLPSAAHVLAAEQIIEIVRQATATRPITVLVDPVLGDDPKGLYIDEPAARAVRDRLLPRADIITPNRFELAWLTGEEVTDGETADGAAKLLSPRLVLATSIPGQGANLLNLLYVDGRRGDQVNVPKRASAPHGTGDLLAALFLGRLLNNEEYKSALRAAVAEVQAAIEASANSDELQLTMAGPISGRVRKT